MAHVSASPAQARVDAAPSFVAIAFVLVAVALFSAMDALSKILASTYDPVEVVWGRYLAILGLLAPLVLRGPRALVMARPRLQLARGVTVLGAALLFIAGLARLPIADATAIGFASPLRSPRCRSRCSASRSAATLGGGIRRLCGVLSSAPGLGRARMGGVAAVLSAVCWGLSLW